MKKYILLLTLFLPLSFSCSVYAQSAEGDIEISGGIGEIAGADIVSILAYNPDASNIKRVFHPIYSLGFKYYLKDKFALGLSVTQHSFSESYFNVYTYRNVSNYCDALSLCVEMKKVYLNREYFQLYSTLGAGVMYLSNASPGFSMYISPIGLRAGKNHAFFAEFGLGYNGLVHGGYCYRF